MAQPHFWPAISAPGQSAVPRTRAALLSCLPAFLTVVGCTAQLHGVSSRGCSVTVMRRAIHSGYEGSDGNTNYTGNWTRNRSEDILTRDVSTFCPCPERQEG